MSVARTRIGRVTMKNGGADVRVLRPRSDGDRAKIDYLIRTAFERFESYGMEVAGMALVIWSDNGSSTCCSHRGERDHIPTLLVPDFVRNCLLSSRIEQQAIALINGEE